MPTAINSLKELDAQLSSAGSRMVVIDFHASWCGPCHAIAPVYERLAQQYASSGVFLKCDVDAARDVAARYSVSAMPTFVFIKNKSPVDTLRGANPQQLQALCQKHAGGAAAGGAFSGKGQTIGGGGGASGSNASGAGSSGTGGASPNPSLLPQLDHSRCTALNELSSRPLRSILRGPSGGSYLESDADEQLLLHLSFAQKVRISHLVLRTASAAADQAPARVRLYVNAPDLGFDDVADGGRASAAQELELTPEDVASGENGGKNGGGGRALPLKFVKFQRVDSLAIAVLANQGGAERTRIDAIDVLGVPAGGSLNMADLKKIDAEAEPRDEHGNKREQSRTGLKGGSGGGGAAVGGVGGAGAGGGQQRYFAHKHTHSTGSSSAGAFSPDRSRSSVDTHSSGATGVSSGTSGSAGSSAFGAGGGAGTRRRGGAGGGGGGSANTSRTSLAPSASAHSFCEEDEEEVERAFGGPRAAQHNSHHQFQQQRNQHSQHSQQQRSRERDHDYARREQRDYAHAHRDAPLGPPRFTARDAEELASFGAGAAGAVADGVAHGVAEGVAEGVDAAVGEGVGLLSWHSAPLVLALAPPLGALLGGKAEHWSNAILLFLSSFWLYQFIRVPWDMYYAARTRKVLQADAVAEERQNETPEQRQVRMAAEAELHRAELVALAWCVLSPLAGAWMLQWLRDTLTDGGDYLNNFNIRLFMLSAGIKPWVHAFRLVRRRLLFLQEEVHYPHSQVEQLRRRLGQLEAELAALRKVYATKSDVRLLRDGIDMPLTQLSRAVRKYEKKEEHLRLSAEDKFGLVESRLEDLLREVAINAELIEVERRERERLANLPMSLFQAVRYALTRRSPASAQQYLTDAPRSLPSTTALGIGPVDMTPGVGSGSGSGSGGGSGVGSPGGLAPQHYAAAAAAAAKLAHANGGGAGSPTEFTFQGQSAQRAQQGTQKMWYEQGSMWYLFLPLNLTNSALKLAGNKAKHLTEDTFHTHQQAIQQAHRPAFAAVQQQHSFKRLDHASG